MLHAEKVVITWIKNIFTGQSKKNQPKAKILCIRREGRLFQVCLSFCPSLEIFLTVEKNRYPDMAIPTALMIRRPAGDELNFLSR